MVSFGNNLRALRQQKNMTQQELSNSMGISKSAINMYERGERQPNFETLELIADYFNVSTDFLIGKVSYIQCPICYNTYDPLNKYDSAEHDVFHKKFIKAEKKYGEILIYGDADKRRSECIKKVNSCTLSRDERLSAFEDYLKYDFMLSIWRNHFDLNHESFELFCQKELGLAITKEALDNIDENAYQECVEKYGMVDNSDYHKIIKITPKDERDIKKDLDSLMEKLSNQEYGPAAYDGDDIPEDDQELFAGQLEIMLRRLKKINKEKYNPNKNQK